MYLAGSLPCTDETITIAFGQEMSRMRYSNTSKLEMEIEGESGLYFVRVPYKSISYPPQCL